jgi:ParB-like chromosome segregation protein Spo0J
MIPFEIRLLPIDSLVPASYNPRRPPTAKARAKLKASLAEFGLVEPLVWNARTGRVVGGHARLELLRELGHAAVPVSVVDLDDDRERALNVVLNNLEAQGRYDPDKLKTVLESLGELSTMTGFDDATLRNLRLEPISTESNERDTGRVEVTIVTDAAGYERIAPRLDDLVREFDLETHIKRI